MPNQYDFCPQGIYNVILKRGGMYTAFYNMKQDIRSIKIILADGRKISWSEWHLSGDFTNKVF